MPLISSLLRWRERVQCFVAVSFSRFCPNAEYRAAPHDEEQR